VDDAALADLERSRPRVVRTEAGLEYLVPPECHLNPVDTGGALVTYDWGKDLPERVHVASGLSTIAFHHVSRAHGLLGEFDEVFVSYHGLGGHLADSMQARTMQAELERLEAEAEHLRMGVHARDDTPAAIQGSRSWRVTRPLRAVGAAVRRRAKG
jgi:hypothetical protein